MAGATLEKPSTAQPSDAVGSEPAQDARNDRRRDGGVGARIPERERLDYLYNQPESVTQPGRLPNGIPDRYTHTMQGMALEDADGLFKLDYHAAGRRSAEAARLRNAPESGAGTISPFDLTTTIEIPSERRASVLRDFSGREKIGRSEVEYREAALDFIEANLLIETGASISTLLQQLADSGKLPALLFDTDVRQKQENILRFETEVKRQLGRADLQAKEFMRFLSATPDLSEVKTLLRKLFEKSEWPEGAEEKLEPFKAAFERYQRGETSLAPVLSTLDGLTHEETLLEDLRPLYEALNTAIAASSPDLDLLYRTLNGIENPQDRALIERTFARLCPEHGSLADALETLLMLQVKTEREGGILDTVEDSLTPGNMSQMLLSFFGGNAAADAGQNVLGKFFGRVLGGVDSHPAPERPENAVVLERKDVNALLEQLNGFDAERTALLLRQELVRLEGEGGELAGSIMGGVLGAGFSTAMVSLGDSNYRLTGHPPARNPGLRNLNPYIALPSAGLGALVGIASGREVHKWIVNDGKYELLQQLTEGLSDEQWKAIVIAYDNAASPRKDKVAFEREAANIVQSALARCDDFQRHLIDTAAPDIEKLLADSISTEEASQLMKQLATIPALAKLFSDPPLAEMVADGVLSYEEGELLIERTKGIPELSEVVNVLLEAETARQIADIHANYTDSEEGLQKLLDLNARKSSAEIAEHLGSSVPGPEGSPITRAENIALTLADALWEADPTAEEVSKNTALLFECISRINSKTEVKIGEETRNAREYIEEKVNERLEALYQATDQYKEQLQKEEQEAKQEAEKQNELLKTNYETELESWKTRRDTFESSDLAGLTGDEKAKKMQEWRKDNPAPTAPEVVAAKTPDIPAPRMMDRIKATSHYTQDTFSQLWNQDFSPHLLADALQNQLIERGITRDGGEVSGRDALLQFAEIEAMIALHFGDPTLAEDGLFSGITLSHQDTKEVLDAVSELALKKRTLAVDLQNQVDAVEFGGYDKPDAVPIRIHERFERPVAGPVSFFDDEENNQRIYSEEIAALVDSAVADARYRKPTTADREMARNGREQQLREDIGDFIEGSEWLSEDLETALERLGADADTELIDLIEEEPPIR
ncbi:hypothetical protein MRY87_00620 [bacterium]|nr:hypothetical protein [bacterium]